MTQTEMPPNDPSGSCGKMRRKMCFVWMVLGIVMLILAASTTLEKYPKLFPVTHSQPVTDNAELEAASLEQRIKTLETRLDELSQRPASQVVTNNPETDATIKNLQTQIEALQAHNEDLQQSVRKIAASALVFGEMREAAVKGRNFAAMLEHFRPIAGNDSAVAQPISKLAPYASNPPPSLPQLKALLLAQETGITTTSVQSENVSLWERIQNLLRPLISVHSAHSPQFAALETALDDGDANVALAAFKTLPLDSQSKLLSLKSGLEAHVTINDALDALQKNLEGG